ncbi:hypothetical protein AB4Y88_23060 [Paenarthrobacter sp. RAF9]
MESTQGRTAPVSIYLDVDGVVNPFSPIGTTDWGNEWTFADAGILEVAFAPEAVAELNASQGWDEGPEWWKLVALQKDLASAGSDRMIWLDDQLSAEPEARSWAEYQQDRVLCISPDPRKGLTRKDLAAVRAYLG